MEIKSHSSLLSILNSVLKLSVLWDMVLLIEPDGGGGTTTLLAILSFYARCNFCL
jgi:hypothetical protein